MKDKKEVIQLLEEMAILMELSDANPFKVRAFSNAARTLQGVSDSVEKLIEEGGIYKIKGIGKGIAEVITNFVKTGEVTELNTLRESIPSGLVDMLRIPGMGPKKIKAVWEKLNITNVGELEYACQENRLVDLDGFGLKTQQKILAGIEVLKKYADRHLLSGASSEAEQIHKHIKNWSGVLRSEIAGSLRRWKETVKDIDILVSADEEDAESIMNHFASLPQVENVIAKGITKTSVLLKSGINADLRLVNDLQFPYALHHFTGSKEHNVAMREIARKQDLKMNEYGLFRGDDENIACPSETEIFENLGMQFIPPELRENYGEIEVALNHDIPQLIELQDLKGMIHVHTHYSDGVNSVEEMANACREKGYQYLVISDHSKTAFYANGLTEERIIQQHKEIDEVNNKLNDFTILKSIESDILPDGKLDYPDETLAKFDLVIGSVHSRFKMTEEEATNRILKAMENPFLTILGHPTGRLLLAREGYPVDMHQIIEAAVELNVALELNANPHRLDMDWRLLKYAKEKGVKISINPDAHRIEGLDEMRYGIGIARKGWLSREDVFNCMTANKVVEFAKNRRK